MDGDTREIHIVPPGMVAKAATAALAALAILALVAAVKGLKEYQFVGAGVSATNTISISGEGEVFAVPDIATFSLSVTEEAKQVEDAQQEATDKINAIIAALDDSGVDEKDIQTSSYNVYPRYEWHETSANGIVRSNGERVLVGFEVSQTLTVKVRDTEKAGEILSQVGSLGATNVSGLSFTIDDEEELKAEARAKAIEDADKKAKVLADDLGVGLIRIVGFYENEGGYPIMYARAESAVMGMGGDAMMDKAPSPQIPTGENKIVSNVTIIYEIR